MGSGESNSGYQTWCQVTLPARNPADSHTWLSHLGAEEDLNSGLHGDAGRTLYPLIHSPTLANNLLLINLLLIFVK